MREFYKSSNQFAKPVFQNEGPCKITLANVQFIFFYKKITLFAIVAISIATLYMAATRNQVCLLESRQAKFRVARS